MNHTSPFGPMAGPVAETATPRIRENVAEVHTGQIRVGGITSKQVIRVGAVRHTKTGRKKFRIYHRVNFLSRAWDAGGEFYPKTIATRWPDVEE